MISGGRWRSLLFVPGDRPERMGKAAAQITDTKFDLPPGSLNTLG